MGPCKRAVEECALAHAGSRIATGGYPEARKRKLAWNIDTVPLTTPVILAGPIVTVSKPPQWSEPPLPA